jgi:GTP-binding protein
MLREREKPFLLAANKVDAKEGRDSLAQFHALPVDRIYGLSAEHGTGVSDLLDEIVARMPEKIPGEGRGRKRRPAYRRSPWSGGPTWGSPPW